MKHSPEPWGLTSELSIRTHHCEANDYSSEAIAEVPRHYYRPERLSQCRPNAERIVECVNALAGVEDPGEAVKALVEAVKDARDMANHIGATSAASRYTKALAPFKEKTNA